MKNATVKKIILALALIVGGGLASLLITTNTIADQNIPQENFNVEARFKLGSVEIWRVVDPDTNTLCYISINSGALSCHR